MEKGGSSAKDESGLGAIEAPRVNSLGCFDAGAKAPAYQLCAGFAGFRISSKYGVPGERSGFHPLFPITRLAGTLSLNHGPVFGLG